ncbi:MAG: thermonuclease family protein [Nitrospirae bacterium]|nr:thermonuclease family protein [Nitrospirota bacterium]
MKEVKDESVHLVVTSPPYWQLKDYGFAGQIGFNDSYEDYINNLNLVWKECYRVLHPGCRMAINIGDQFARSVYYGRYKIIPIREEIIRFCETIGLDYMGAVIWQKKTSMNTTGGATIMGSFPYPRNGILELDYEFILIFKKLGTQPVVSRQLKEEATLTKEEWKEYFSGHWYFNGAKQDKHIAMFPEELPKRLIKMFTFPGEVVLDPFLGSGTTTLAARNLERNSVGYEANEELLPVVKEKVGVGRRGLFEDVRYEVLRQKNLGLDWSDEVEKLPYRFKDPIKFDKKVSPEKLKFGSKVAFGDTGERDTYFRIKEVVSPELVVLDNGLKVRLIGVKEDVANSEAAIEFLKLKTGGQYVFLRYDTDKHDRDGNLLAYLYLKNKTFVNAHLVKRGLASPDSEGSYKYKAKFMSILKDRKSA